MRFGNGGNNVPMIVIPSPGTLASGGMRSGHFVAADYNNQYSVRCHAAVYLSGTVKPGEGTAARNHRGAPGRCASIPASYGCQTGAKPDGGVASTPGAAVAVSGTVGGVVVVAVCPVYSGTTGRATCSGAADPTSPKIPPSAPMATAALRPIVANPNFHCLACTCDDSNP